MLRLSGLKTAYILHLICVAIIFKLLNCIFFSYISCIKEILEYTLICLCFNLLAWFSFRFTKKKFLNKRIQFKDSAVFITGCDRGFGHLLAKRLDSKGFNVFAGCLFPLGAGAQELNLHCSKRLRTLELDVTSDESVKKAYEFVKTNLNGSELRALVNNAGIRKGTVVELTSLEDFKSCMEVNCFGVIRMTKVFLPLIKKSRGRIVNVTSIAGRLAFPSDIAYATSKFAVTGFIDALRHELNVRGVRVISIEPDFFRTPLLNMEDYEKRLDESIRHLDQNIRDDYGEKYFEDIKKRERYFHSDASSNFNLVLDDIEYAICLRYPDLVYRPMGFFRNKLFTNICLALPYDLQIAFMSFVNRYVLLSRRTKK